MKQCNVGNTSYWIRLLLFTSGQAEWIVLTANPGARIARKPRVDLVFACHFHVKLCERIGSQSRQSLRLKIE